MSHVLVVEDEPALADAIVELLQADGYEVTLARTAAEARAGLTPAIDLVLLDWMLPDGHGVDLLKEWRRTSNVPVIFVTARTQVVDRVVGLELGADDYVTKPFESRELLARIKARLRGRPASAASQLLRHAEFAIDLSERTATFEGAALTLTKMELELLSLFVSAPGRVFSREEILNKVWGYDRMPTTRTVDTHVLQLRNKTRADLFESVRGIGYRLKKEG